VRIAAITATVIAIVAITVVGLKVGTASSVGQPTAGTASEMRVEASR